MTANLLILDLPFPDPLPMPLYALFSLLSRAEA